MYGRGEEYLGTKVKSVLEKGKGAAQKVPKKIWILIAALLVVAAAAIVIVSLNKDDNYQVLVTGMNANETAAVLNFLDSEGVTGYRVENNDTVLVPAGQEPLLKAKLLMEGYPDSGFGYSTYYDHVSALSTESERNVAYLTLLNERMGAVVRCFDGVKDAQVTIAQGQDRTYVLDSSNITPATASVIVTMQDGAQLTKEQAAAIRTLISRSVQGLEVSSVAISDPYGVQFDEGVGEFDTSDLSALKLQLEAQNNNLIRSEVLMLLTPWFGDDNVRVAVHCTVDVNKVTEESTTYRQPDGSEEHAGLINSRIYDHDLVRGEDGTYGGVVGAEVNADLPSYMEETATANGDEREIHIGGQQDFSIDENKQYIEHVAGYITDCTISVTLNSTTAGTAVDVAQLRNHVANAAGMTYEEAEGRVSIVSMPFYNPAVPDEPEEEPTGFFATLLGDVPDWVLLAAAGGLLLFIILLVVILVAVHKRKKKKRQLEEEQAKVDELVALMEVGQAAAAEPVQGGADVMDINTERSMELRKDIRKFADENPEIAAQMIRTLLKGGESDG